MAPLTNKLAAMPSRRLVLAKKNRRNIPFLRPFVLVPKELGRINILSTEEKITTGVDRAERLL